MSTSTDLSDSIRAQYVEEYIKGAERRRVYDFFCYPVSTDRAIMQRQSSIVLPFLGRMAPGSTAISETVDITPQTLDDTTASMTTTSRGEAIQDSEKLLLDVYTDYAARRAAIVGENMQESIEANLVETALAGTIVQRTAARASLDAGTATHRLSYLDFQKMQNRLASLRCPMYDDKTPTWLALMALDPYYDLRVDTPILAVAEYQNAAILFGQDELGIIDKFRVVASPWAKTFMGAGADNASAVATTTTAAVSQLEAVLPVASATNITVGEWLNVGTEETSTTFYPGNERVRYVSTATLDITVVGSADNGGFAYDHASGVAVNNNDSVYPVLCGGPFSVAKAYASDMGNGEFGQMVGPLKQGLVEQWVSLGWKWYGGFGRISENWLGRIEVASSLEA
jgi:N4-gp56 family major capsid protein